MRLAETAELMSGANHVPLLFLGARRVYVRLSPLGAEVVRFMMSKGEVSQDDLVRAVGAHGPAEPRADEAVGRFVEQLHAAGALSDDLPRARRLLRLPLWRPRQPFQLGAVRGSAILRRAGMATLAVCVTVSSVLVVSRWPELSGGRLDRDPTVLLLLVAAVLVHLLLHELSHVTAAAYYGIKPREVGVALLYGILPTAYADLTDVYRLPKRSQRGWIALAGPIFDVCAAGASAAASAFLPGKAGPFFESLLALQVAMFGINVSLFLPSDFLRAAEAWAGGLNFRRRALTVCVRRFSGRPLPPHLQSLSRMAQLGHIAYVVAAVITLLQAVWLARVLS